MYIANINGTDVEITEEENAEYAALAAAIPPPSESYQKQIEDIEGQNLDIAEAVTSLYETMLAGVTA